MRLFASARVSGRAQAAAIRGFSARLMPAPPIEEIAQHRVAMFRGDGFGVELHPFDGQIAVAQAHDGAVLDPWR
jgi:hypothetical protein